MILLNYCEICTQNTHSPRNNNKYENRQTLVLIFIPFHSMKIIKIFGWTQPAHFTINKKRLHIFHCHFVWDPSQAQVITMRHSVRHLQGVEKEFSGYEMDYNKVNTPVFRLLLKTNINSYYFRHRSKYGHITITFTRIRNSIRHWLQWQTHWR